MYDIREWRHVFKLDPNKTISDDALEKLCESGQMQSSSVARMG